MHGASADKNNVSALSLAELAAAVSTLQVELVGVKSQMREGEAQNASLRETIVNLTHENQLLKRRIFGNKTERTQTSELQLALGGLLDEEKQLQKQLDEAMANANAASNDDGSPSRPSEKPKAKPKGRRNLLTSGPCPKSPSRFSTPSWRRLPNESASSKASTSCTFAAATQCSSSGPRNTRSPARMGRRCRGGSAQDLFPRGILHSSVVAHILVQKFSLGVPHYRLEQHIQDQGVELGRGTMCRYVEEAGNAVGATIVHAMWQDALENGCVISTDATSALVQPIKSQGAQRQACKKGHFFTAVVDTDHILFAYAERHVQEFVKKLFHGFSGFLQCDAQRLRHPRARASEAG